MRLSRLYSGALLCLSCALNAQSAPSNGAPRAMTVTRAVRIQDVIRIDGRLDEVEWSKAPVTDHFTQLDPDEGKPASQRTEVRVLYDASALYVGVRLHDSGQIIGRLGRRDMSLGDSDWFGLMIDSYHDLRTAFGFDVNPAGVKRDEIKTINTDDNSWDAVWDAATSVDSAGWTIEYKIPFSQLGFSGATEQVWGIQFERVIGRNREYAVSTFSPKSDQGGVPRYGELHGVRDIQQGHRLELLPYTVGKATATNPGANVLKPAHEQTGSAGLDLRYRLTSNLALNAAFNPDFGQVEVDPAVVNLGVYETFFDEKRPFFVEGSEIFDFGAAGTSGGRLFYSRRIGRAPSLAAPSSISDAPDATTILGAAKLSGKGAGWSFGMLDAVTDREVATYRTSSNTDGRFAVEPRANNLAIRARREMRGGQTIIGGVLTAVNRSLDTPDFEATLRREAYATGVDFRHQWGNRTWYAQGDAEISHVAGSAAAILATQRQSNHYFQRPDGAHLPYDSSATSLDGYSVNVAIGRQAGLHWRGALAAALTSPAYEVNDLGYSYRTDRRDGQLSVTYLENQPGPTIRKWSVTGTVRSEHNFAWQPILTFSTVNAQLTTLSYWTAQAIVQRYFTALDDRLTRGGPIALRPAWWVTTARLYSDGRKPVTLTMVANVEDHDFGSWGWNVGVNVGVKTSSRWNLTVGPTVTKFFTPAQYVTSVGDATFTPMYGRRYVFAPLHQTSVGVEARFNVTFTPRLSLETYMQPLLSSGDYGNARQLLAPKSFDFAPYTAPAPNLDFNLRSLRGNAVLRWEWRAGSTLYVAWQQRRSDYAPTGDFSFGRDSRALFDARPDNILLLKVNYWFTP